MRSVLDWLKSASAGWASISFSVMAEAKSLCDQINAIWEKAEHKLREIGVLKPFRGHLEPHKTGDESAFGVSKEVWKKMSFISGFRGLALASVAVCGWASQASAAVLITAQQVGADIELTFSGSFSFSGGFTTPFGGNNVSISQDTAMFLAVQSTSNSLRYFNMTRTSGPSAKWFGSTFSSQGSFAVVGLQDLILRDDSNFRAIYFSSNYTSGTPISGKVTFSNKSIVNDWQTNFGDYVYSYPYAGGADTVTMRFVNPGGGGGQVPEPTSMAIFGIGALGFAYRARRKSKA